MQSVSPVFTLEEVQFEREIKTHNSPGYLPIIGLPVTLRMIDKDDPTKTKDVPDWAIAVRLRLSEEERAQVAAGLDLVIVQLTFGERFHPTNLQFCHSATRPILEVREAPPASAAEALNNVVQMPKSEEPTGEPLGSCAGEPDHDPSGADLDAVAADQTQADATARICPSCGETDKTAASDCANAWHTEGVEKVLTEPASDQPQS